MNPHLAAAVAPYKERFENQLDGFTTEEFAKAAKCVLRTARKLINEDINAGLIKFVGYRQTTDLMGRNHPVPVYQSTKVTNETAESETEEIGQTQSGRPILEQRRDRDRPAPKRKKATRGVHTRNDSPHSTRMDRRKGNFRS